MTDREELNQFMLRLVDLILTDKFPEIDKILENSNWQEMSDVMLIAICRLTKIVKDHLPHWEISLRKSYDELIRRSMPADIILSGLT